MQPHLFLSIAFSAALSLQAGLGQRLDRLEIVPDLSSPIRETGTTGATVSAQELRQPLPGRANRALSKAKKARAQGKLDLAIQHMEEVVRIAPHSSSAINDLGVLYLERGEGRAAVDAFDKAVRLDPRSANLRLSLAMAWLELDRLAEAETAARQARALAERRTDVAWVLATILVRSGRFTSETLGLLAQAQADYPEALLWMAEAWRRTGEPSLAREAIRNYLSSGQTAHRDFAENRLRVLSQK